MKFYLYKQATKIWSIKYLKLRTWNKSKYVGKIQFLELCKGRGYDSQSNGDETEIREKPGSVVQGYRVADGELEKSRLTMKPSQGFNCWTLASLLLKRVIKTRGSVGLMQKSTYYSV